MKHIYLYGCGAGLVSSSLLFWLFFLQVKLSKQHNYNQLAMELFTVEITILIIGVGCCVYALWKK